MTQKMTGRRPAEQNPITGEKITYKMKGQGRIGGSSCLPVAAPYGPFSVAVQLRTAELAEKQGNPGT
jgi:hypothetical protein